MCLGIGANIRAGKQPKFKVEEATASAPSPQPPSATTPCHVITSPLAGSTLRRVQNVGIFHPGVAAPSSWASSQTGVGRLMTIAKTRTTTAAVGQTSPLRRVTCMYFGGGEFARIASATLGAALPNCLIPKAV